MRCTLVTDSVFDSIIKIEQTKLDCQSYLTSKTSNSVILPLSYVHGAPKATYGISDFFTVAPKDGCDNTETCALNAPLTKWELIKTNWYCHDSDVAGSTYVNSIDECDALCQEAPLCVWFAHR